MPRRIADSASQFVFVPICELAYALIAPTGGKAEIRSKRRDFYGYENLPESSFGTLLGDMVLEAATGISLTDDDPEEVLVRTIVYRSVSLPDTPGDIWQLEAERLRILASESIGSPSVWGYGILVKRCANAGIHTPWCFAME